MKYVSVLPWRPCLLCFSFDFHVQAFFDEVSPTVFPKNESKKKKGTNNQGLYDNAIL